MGMQVPCSVDTEVQTEKAVRRNQRLSWRRAEKTGAELWMRDIGRAHNAGSYPCAHIDTAENISITCDGYIKGKSAIYIAKRFRGRTKNFTGENFWARGYYVSTVGRDEKMIREYIKNQEEEDKQLDLLNQ